MFGGRISLSSSVTAIRGIASQAKLEYPGQRLGACPDGQEAIRGIAVTIFDFEAIPQQSKLYRLSRAA